MASGSITFTHTPVVAKTRKLKVNYTIELAQDLNAMHGISEWMPIPSTIEFNPVIPWVTDDLIENSGASFNPIVPCGMPDSFIPKPWANKLEQDTKAYYTKDAEKELTAILVEEIKKEIDAEIVKTLVKTVKTKHGEADADKWKTSPSGLLWVP